MFAQAMNRENYTCFTYRLVESRTRKRISLQCIHMHQYVLQKYINQPNWVHSFTAHYNFIYNITFSCYNMFFQNHSCQFHGSRIFIDKRKVEGRFFLATEVFGFQWWLYVQNFFVIMYSCGQNSQLMHCSTQIVVSLLTWSS